jgi:hypothetical protein
MAWQTVAEPDPHNRFDRLIPWLLRGKTQDLASFTKKSGVSLRTLSSRVKQ